MAVDTLTLDILDKAAAGEDIHDLRIAVRSGDAVLCAVRTRALSPLSRRDIEDLRWYLEDYPQAPFDPAPQVATRIARRLEECGTDLFATLVSADPSDQVLACLRNQLPSFGPKSTGWHS